MRYPRLVLGTLVCLVMFGATVLVGWAAVRASAEDELRHGVVAERVFDAIEDELSELVQREEQRSFLEYRHYYVPGRQSQGAPPGLVRSPLADLPTDGVVLGWFQVDPDGSVFLPHEPREGEQALASADGWQAPAGLEAVRERLVAGARRGSMLVTRPQPVQLPSPRPGSAIAAGAPPPPPPPEPAPVVRWKSTVGSSLNRGADKRSQRVSRKVRTQSQNVVGFVDNETADLRDLVAEPLVAVTTDVDVGAFQGATGDDVVLFRHVQVDGETYVQGLVVDRARLWDRLTERVLGPDLLPYADLQWGAGAAAPQHAEARAHAFEHRFEAPFQDMQASLAVHPLPDASTTLWPLLVLTGLLGVSVLVGVVALDRMVAAELDFAQRRTDFVAAVSHELKTPLTAIRMYAEMLRDGVVLSDEHRQGYYVTIAAESERLSRLIANVLTLGRLKRGVGGRLVVGDVGAVLREVAAILGPHAEARGFALEVHVPPDLPPARIDRDALLQVLVNLVDNAVKFSDGADDRRVTLAARADGPAVEVRVRDRGPGIPVAQLAHVCEPFYRGERELTRTTTGTGIGLALVRGLVQRMNGRVRLHNHVDGGLEVVVRLLGAPAG